MPDNDPPEITKTQRVIAYIDGFNLYYPLKDLRWKRFYWLNVHALVTHFIRPNQQLVRTRYYTSRALSTGSRSRQSVYINALLTVPEISIKLGEFRRREQTCKKCNWKDDVPTEKMTDVNIATDLLLDCVDGAMDVAILVTADSDLTPPLSAIQMRYPGVSVVILFPPEKTSGHLSSYASGSMQIGRARLNQSRFPDTVLQPNGVELKRPLEWA